MRRMLECCRVPSSIINWAAPYTYEQAKEALLKANYQLLTSILNSSFQLPKEQDSLLLVALTEGREDAVLFLIRQHGERFEFNRRNDKGDTPLMIAIFRKMFKILKILMQKCDINGCDFRRNTPFIAAAANGDIECLKILAESSACNTSMRNIEGQTALHRACYFGEIAAVDWLLANSELKVSERDSRGNNGLHMACEGLNIPLTRYLMKKVINSEQKLLTPNNQGKLPQDILMTAIYSVSPNFKQTSSLDHLGPTS